MMQPAPRFSEMPYERPKLETLQQRNQALLDNWDAADGANEQLAVIKAWDSQLAYFQSNQTLAMVHFQQQTDSETAKAEKSFFDDINPVVMEGDLKFIQRVTSSPHRRELEEHLGHQAFALWECFINSFKPEIADLKREESKLGTEYSSIMAAIRVDFRGTSHNLSTLRAFFGDPDRGTRLEAQQKRSAALGEVSSDLDRIYHEQVQIRHKMATKLGFENYIPLGYSQMNRTDYTADDVATYRRQVREHVVPLAGKIYARRAKSLNIDSISFHDEPVRDLKGVPCPSGDHDWMMNQATQLFDTMGPDFGDFFKMMAECELLDLKSRPGKAGGGFCADIPRYGVPFIFANFNGTQDDVNVFTHECGHAFQNWCSRDLELLLYHWPTYEAAEIHSMSLEFLTYPHMEMFFGDDAERYRTGHLEDAILFLPYGCAVDEFQHRAYENPGMTPDERAEVWREIEAIYLPHRTYERMSHHESGRLWQQQRHIFSRPFYYIDYCLAQTCALQMWHMSRQDRTTTMKQYRQLCKLGGSLPFTGLLDAVGLANPFKAGCLTDVCNAAAASLKLN